MASYCMYESWVMGRGGVVGGEVFVGVGVDGVDGLGMVSAVPPTHSMIPLSSYQNLIRCSRTNINSVPNRRHNKRHKRSPLPLHRLLRNRSLLRRPLTPRFRRPLRLAKPHATERRRRKRCIPRSAIGNRGRGAEARDAHGKCRGQEL